jgi:hypothetical protein
VRERKARACLWCAQAEDSQPLSEYTPDAEGGKGALGVNERWGIEMNLKFRIKSIDF